MGTTYVINVDHEIPPEGLEANPTFCKTIIFPPKFSAKETEIRGCFLTAEFDLSAFAASCSNQLQSCAVNVEGCPGTVTLGNIELRSREGAGFPLDVKVPTTIGEAERGSFGAPRRSCR